MRFVICLVALLLTPLMVQAQDLTVGESEFLRTLGEDAPVIRLWPEGRMPASAQAAEEEKLRAPREGVDPKRAQHIVDVNSPSMILMLPKKEKNTGAAMVMAPGGGYVLLDVDIVMEAARWWNDRGVAVAVLKYRVPSKREDDPVHPAPLQDAQRAISLLRAKASEWDIDPKKIGVAGFSAGGHLAANAANHGNDRAYEPVDEADKASCRPDFSVLLYPGYLTASRESHELNPHLRMDKLSPSTTPPTFLAINGDDRLTPGVVAYSIALMDAKVPSEMHIYASGGHGGAVEKYPFGQWANECYRFLGDHKFLPPIERRPADTYRAGTLPEAKIPEGMTEGDWHLRQILGKDWPILSVWPGGTGPDETRAETPESVTQRSRGGRAINIRDVNRPSLTVITPDEGKGNGRCVIVCPGGGYGGLAAEHEGTKICEWLTSQGFVTVLLKYRVPRRGGEFEKHHHALQDVQRSMRIVRSNAEKWGVDTNQIGVLGFSAGGHLCTTLATNYETPSYEAIDEIDQVSAKPNFAVLVYPAYLTKTQTSDEVESLVSDVSPENTPPMFLTVARDDPYGRGMMNYLYVLQAAGVPFEAHMYDRGGHGGGIDSASYPSSEWSKACERWLKDIAPKN
jgi:acetyl esterase/lipase